MNLQGQTVNGADGLFQTISLVMDEDIQDSGNGQLVALVIYSHGAGNVIYWHRQGYDPMQVMIAGERIVGEAFSGNRFKEYDCVVRASADHPTR